MLDVLCFVCVDCCSMRCWLLVVRCSSRVGCCVLSVFCCVMCVVCCLRFAVCCVMAVGCCVLHVDGRVFVLVRWLLRAIRCSLLIVRYMSFVD